MGTHSTIEWCDSTFNPWLGCSKVSPGCDHCYAERQMDTRMGRVRWGAGQSRQRTSAAYWRQPEQWNAQPFAECMGCGWRGELRHAATVENPPGFHPPIASTSACPSCREPMLREARRRVFCASLADVFDNDAPPDWRVDLLTLITRTPNLDWLLLTKRIGNAADMLDAAAATISHRLFGTDTHMALCPPNVWLGATVVNQAEADRDIPKLLATPAEKRFVSIEPMLGPINLSSVCIFNAASLGRFQDSLRGHRWDESAHEGGGRPLPEDPPSGPALDWVIVGGESGPDARPVHPDWVRSLRGQCWDAGVPFLFKQWGAWVPASETAGGWFSYAVCRHGRLSAFDQDSMRAACPDCTRWEALRRPGKHAAGRTLDGREWLEFPA